MNAHAAGGVRLFSMLVAVPFALFVLLAPLLVPAWVSCSEGSLFHNLGLCTSVRSGTPRLFLTKRLTPADVAAIGFSDAGNDTVSKSYELVVYEGDFVQSRSVSFPPPNYHAFICAPGEGGRASRIISGLDETALREMLRKLL